MLIRAVDYVANPGGGLRFALELMRALGASRPELRFEIVSHGPALDRYRKLLRCDRSGLEHVSLVSLPSPGTRALAPSLPARAARKLLRLLGQRRVTARHWGFPVPRAAFEGCDLLWLPWSHRHRIPESASRKVVASFQDVIVFRFPSLLPHWELEQERALTQDLISSRARLVIGSRTTRDDAARIFEVGAERFSLVPLSGDHVRRRETAGVSQPLWPKAPFLLTPANLSPHKNHEVLLRGFAAGGMPHPLVLTGYEAELSVKSSRGAALRELARSLGLSPGRSIFPLGYVSDAYLLRLLRAARAVVVPTLAEGGGSFPVYEAVTSGIPVLCSDIPVLREQLERMQAEVLWFDPRNPDDLAAKLHELERGYARHKERALCQVTTLRRRRWSDVADEYWSIFRATAAGDAGA